MAEAYATIVVDETTGDDGRLKLSRRWKPRKKGRWRVEMYAEREATIDDALAAELHGVEPVAVGDIIEMRQSLVFDMCRFDALLRQHLLDAIDNLLPAGANTKKAVCTIWEL